MADDLKIIIKSILEADEKSSADRISKQLPDIAKDINAKSKIKLQLEIDKNQANGQISSIVKQLSDSIHQVNKKIKLGFDTSTSKTFSKSLEDVVTRATILEGKFKQLSIGIPKDIVTRFAELNAQLKKISNLPDGSKKIDVFKRATNELHKLNNEYKILIQSQRNAKKPIIDETLAVNIEKARQRLLNFKQSYSAFTKDKGLYQEWAKLFDSSHIVKSQEELRKLNSQISLFENKLVGAGKNVRTTWDELSNNFKKFLNWFLIGGATAEVFRSLSQIVENVKELNTNLVELRKVTTASDVDLNAFLDKAKKKSVDLGSSLTDLVKATANFSRLNFTLPESETLGQVATIYQNVGDDVNSIEDATDSIISTMKAFNIEAKDSITIVDKLNEVSNKESISAGGLGEALRRSASAMAAANNTLDETIGLIVAGNEVVRDVDAVGTALKTSSLRIRGSTAELQDMGEEIDELVKSTPKLRDELLALSGVDIMENADTFKSTFQIYKEIAEVLPKLSDINQATILEDLFGKRQANIGASILSNFASAEKSLAESLNSAGSAMKEHGIWLDSIDAKQKQAAAQFQAFSDVVLNSDLVKGYYDVSTGILGFLTNIVDKIGVLPTLVGVAAGALSGLKNIGISKVKYALPYSMSMVA